MSMAPEMITQIVDIISIIVIGLLQGIFLLLVRFFGKKYLEKRKEGRALYDLGLLIFFCSNFFVNGVSIVLLYLYRYMTPLNFNFALFIYVFIAYIGLAVLTFAIEYEVLQKKTKCIFSIIAATYTIFMVFIGIFTRFEITFITAPFSYMNLFIVSVLPGVFFYLAYKGTGDIRKFSLAFGFGYAFMIFGGICQPILMQKLISPILAIPPIYWYVAIWGLIQLTAGMIILLLATRNFE